MSQLLRYKTETWQPRNLIGFFLIAFGWTWFWWALFIGGRGHPRNCSGFTSFPQWSD
jgi:hypothetical protein